MVDHSVVGDAQQPAQERLALIAVGTDAVQCPDEDLLAEVLREFYLPGVHVDVAVDPGRVFLIEQTESIPMPFMSHPDEVQNAVRIARNATRIAHDAVAGLGALELDWALHIQYHCGTRI